MVQALGQTWGSEYLEEEQGHKEPPLLELLSVCPAHWAVGQGSSLGPWSWAMSWADVRPGWPACSALGTEGLMKKDCRKR